MAIIVHATCTKCGKYDDEVELEVGGDIPVALFLCECGNDEYFVITAIDIPDADADIEFTRTHEDVFHAGRGCDGTCD